MAAQDTLATGTRIRAAGPDGSVSGSFLAMSQDSLLIGLTDFNITRVVPLAGITVLKRNLKTNENHPLRGALLGTFIGLTVGAIASVPNTDGLDDKGAWAGSGALVGAGLGLLIGEVAGRDRWQKAMLPAARPATLPPADLRPEFYTQAQLRHARSDKAVRLLTFDGRDVRGFYIGHEEGRIRVLGDTLQLVPFASVRTIQQLRPATFSFAKRGAVTGAIAGALFMLIPAALADSCPKGGPDPGGCMDGRGLALVLSPLTTAAGGVTGLILGAVIGSATDRWQTVR
jgi:hypothetical protein